MRILVVEDNRRLNTSLKTSLEEDGYAVDVAFDGDEGEAYALAAPYDLILLDLLMPGMEGDVVLQRFKKNERLRGIKVIGVSAAVADKGRAEQFAAACDAFLAKPLDIRELQEQLKEQLQIEWIEEEPEAGSEPLTREEI